MKWLALFFALAVAAFVVFLLAKRKGSKHREDTDQPWPYYAKKPLTEIEQMLYHRLVEAMPECIVLAQVQLSRIIGVKKGAGPGNWLNRINQKSIDYVVCLKDSSLVATVELDDSSHNREDRRKADQDKDRALASAGVRLIRWQARNLPDVKTIRETFTK